MINDFYDMDHVYFMKEAIKEAEKAGQRGDRPIGSVIAHNGEIISRGSNHIETLNSNLAHAEIDSMQQCASYLKKYARECIIYSTVEPCVMCLSTIVMANIRNIVFASEDNYMNMQPFIESNPYIKTRVHHYLGGVLREESLEVIRKYAPDMLDILLKEAEGEFT